MTPDSIEPFIHLSIDTYDEDQCQQAKRRDLSEAHVVEQFCAVWHHRATKIESDLVVLIWIITAKLIKTMTLNTEILENGRNMSKISPFNQKFIKSMYFDQT